MLSARRLSINGTHFIDEKSGKATEPCEPKPVASAIFKVVQATGKTCPEAGAGILDATAWLK